MAPAGNGAQSAAVSMNLRVAEDKTRAAFCNAVRTGLVFRLDARTFPP